VFDFDGGFDGGSGLGNCLFGFIQAFHWAALAGVPLLVLRKPISNVNSLFEPNGVFESGFPIVDWNHVSDPRNGGYVQLKVKPTHDYFLDNVVTNDKVFKVARFRSNNKVAECLKSAFGDPRRKGGQCNERTNSPASACWQSKVLQALLPRFSKAAMHTYLPAMEHLFEGDFSTIENMAKSWQQRTGRSPPPPPRSSLLESGDGVTTAATAAAAAASADSSQLQRFLHRPTPASLSFAAVDAPRYQVQFNPGGVVMHPSSSSSSAPSSSSSSSSSSSGQHSPEQELKTGQSKPPPSPPPSPPPAAAAGIFFQALHVRTLDPSVERDRLDRSKRVGSVSTFKSNLEHLVAVSDFCTFDRRRLVNDGGDGDESTGPRVAAAAAAAAADGGASAAGGSSAGAGSSRGGGMVFVASDSLHLKQLLLQRYVRYTNGNASTTSSSPTSFSPSSSPPSLSSSPPSLTRSSERVVFFKTPGSRLLAKQGQAISIQKAVTLMEFWLLSQVLLSL
jgi:hypothetical protein